MRGKVTARAAQYGSRRQGFSTQALQLSPCPCSNTWVTLWWMVLCLKLVMCGRGTTVANCLR